MRTFTPILATMALVGFCSHANAQAGCPELTRLHMEAAKVEKRATGVPTGDRCEAYVRFSIASREVVQFASDHREACDISDASLSVFEKYHRDAVKARDNVCANRPARPYPPDIIRR